MYQEESLSSAPQRNGIGPFLRRPLVSDMNFASPLSLQRQSIIARMISGKTQVEWGRGYFIWWTRLEFQIKMSFLAFPYDLFVSFFRLIRMLKRSFEMGRPFLKPFRESVCHEVGWPSPPPRHGVCAEPTRADSRPVTSPSPVDVWSCSRSLWITVAVWKQRRGWGDLVPGHWCPECSVQSRSQLRHSGGNLQPSRWRGFIPTLRQTALSLTSLKWKHIKVKTHCFFVFFYQDS